MIPTATPKAVVLLTSSFFLWAIQRALFVYDRGGASRFRANFDHEGLLPVPKEVRPNLAKWQACIGCGLCDMVCPDHSASQVPGLRAQAPQFLASSVLRELPKLKTNAALATHLSSCADCSLCEETCPTSVPIKDIVAFIAAAEHREH